MRPRSFSGSGLEATVLKSGLAPFGVYASCFIAYNRGPRRGLSWCLRSGSTFRRAARAPRGLQEAPHRGFFFGDKGGRWSPFVFGAKGLVENA